MGILKAAGVAILSLIGLIIFATVMALGTLFSYFYLQMLLFGRGEYLLFVSGDLNMIPVSMIIILIIYVFIAIKDKFSKKKEERVEIIEEEDEPVDVDNPGRLGKLIYKLLNKILEHYEAITKVFDVIEKAFKAIKICYIPALIIAIYCGMTSYAILYTDTVKVSSPVNPGGVIYKYSDIKSIDVGVENDGRDSYSPYYEVTFDDGKSVNLFGGSMHEDNDIGFEYILIDLDEKLLSQGVSKTVSKENFEKYAEGLDKDFISRVKKLFDNK